MKKILLCSIFTLLFSLNGYAEDFHFSRMSKSTQQKVLKIWRKELRKEMQQIVKSLPMQIDSTTTIDGAFFLNNSLTYLASISDEGIQEVLADTGAEMSVEEFWDNDFYQSYMKTTMFSQSKNYVCTNAQLNVHLDIGTIESVKYQYTRDDGRNLFESVIDNCDGYEKKPFVLPNGHRLFP